MEHTGKVALVTGAGDGIGRAIALALAREGADVVVNDLVLDRAEGVGGEIAALGRRALPIAADVAQGAAVDSMFERAMAAFGRLDILVNNAGIGQRLLAEDITEADWRRVIDVNLTGAFLCARAAIRIMKPRRTGHIVNVASIAGKRISINGGAHYTAAKAGIIGLTRHLAYELGPYGIRVNAICPGETLTALMERIGDPAPLEQSRRRTPLGRLATPEDQANAVLLLLSERAGYITGVALDVDGGILLGWMELEAYEAVRKGKAAVAATG
ncbi:MAG: SDR family oxidoreductase [Candidatus Rokubacteria bacterium]|nr:SDR family oxidoreductase [Candidatus Rokubacteria bacterium]